MRKKILNMLISVSVWVYIYIYIYMGVYECVSSNRFQRAGCNTAALNSEFSFSYSGFHINFNMLILPYYLSITRGKIVRFITFPMLLVLYEMQLALSRIWTCVTLLISNDQNHYTTVIYILGPTDALWIMNYNSMSI